MAREHGSSPTLSVDGLTPAQKALLATLGATLTAGALAAISPEVRRAVERAGQEAGTIARETVDELAALAGRTVETAGRRIVTPLAEAVEADLRAHPLEQRVQDAFAALRRMAGRVVDSSPTPGPVAQRVRIEQ